MKNKHLFLSSFLIFCLHFCMWAQREILQGTVLDGIYFYPIEGANIYNFSTKKYVFSDKQGNFSIEVQEGDTLVISKGAYRQCVELVNKEMMVLKKYDFMMYYKAIMLKEVQVYALNPDYEGFKKEVVNMKLPEVYKKLEGIELSADERNMLANANTGPNLLRGTPAANPISYFYNKFSKKEKMKRLASELEEKQEEVDIVQTKYNRELVKKLTGLSDDEVVDFMMFCRFSYYDIIRWPQNEIESKIKSNFVDYQYNKALQEKE